MVIAYALVCSCVWAVLQSLSEMTIAFPVSGNYIDYAHRWVDPSLAFGAGFAEWLGMSNCLIHTLLPRVKCNTGILLTAVL